MLRQGSPAEQVTVLDMGVGGAFIESSVTLDFGLEVQLDIQLSEDQHVLVDAIAAWSKRGGFGVHFGAMGARETYLITELLKDMEPVPDSRRPPDS
jgi:hypothetical protein